MDSDPARNASLRPLPSISSPGSRGGDRIIYASIVALALGVIPIVSLSDRMAFKSVDLSRLILCAVLLCAALTSSWLARAGHKKAASILLVGVVWTGVTAFAFVSGLGLHSSTIYLYIVAILYTSLLLGVVPAAVQTGLTVAALTAMWWAEATGRIDGLQYFMQKTTVFNYYLGVVVATIASLVIAAVYQRTVERCARLAHEANEKLAVLNASLERGVAERTRELEATIAELESFNYSVAHDLRTPLRAINGYASMLGDSQVGRLDAGALRQLERIAAEATRMDGLLSALLALGHVGRRPLSPADIDMSALVATIAGELALTADGEHTQFMIQPDLRARGDRHLLRSVLENLLGNAVKFSRGRERPEVEFGFATDTPRGAAFYVRDNGAGFNPAFAAQLYKPFHRLHSDKEFAGVGIGLASVRRIMERHGGQIWAVSRESEGATFYFTLPVRLRNVA